MAVEPLLAVFSLALSGMAFAAWFFGFEIRKTFKGGIFWGAWRLVATAFLFNVAHELVMAYAAVVGASFATDAISDSFEAIATLMFLSGIYLFYKAWNPKVHASGR